MKTIYWSRNTPFFGTEVSYADVISKYWLHLAWNVLCDHDTVWYGYGLSYI